MSQCEGAIWSRTAGESTERPEGTTDQREAMGQCPRQAQLPGSHGLGVSFDLGWKQDGGGHASQVLSCLAYLSQ